MLNNLKAKFRRFMYGRYGADHLYIASLVLYFVIQVIQLFARSGFLNLISFVLIFWALFRALSKNLPARRAENQKFLKLTRVVQSKWQLQKRKVQDIKTHRYRSCSQCQAILRLPFKKGKHKTTCPKCGHSNQVTIRF